MTEFQEDILTIIIDKGLLAIALAFVAGLVKWWLQRDQASRDLLKQIAPKRAEAYEILWKVTEETCRKKPSEMDQDFRDKMHDKFNEAYFDRGAAMYLSHNSASEFIKCKRKLIDETVDAQYLVDELSSFRTQLKHDLKIYSKREAMTPLDI